MSRATDRSPQLGRIARLLHVDPDEVHGLDAIADDDLRALHDLIGHAIFGEHQQRFARVAGLSKVLPGPVAGKLAERFVPPTLAARIAEMLEPAKARDLVSRVSVDYLAEISLALDPTRSRPVVQQIPTPHVAAVARTLFGRREYAAMAEFAGTVTLEALFAALDVATARDLLEVVPLLVWNDNIGRVISDVPIPRIEELVHEIAGSDPTEIADLVDRLAPIAQRVPPERVAEVARALFDGGHYEPMALLVKAVSVEGLSAALDVATAHDLLEVVPLLEWNDNLALVIAEVPIARIAELAHEVTRSDADVDARIAGLRPIAHAVPPERIAEVARALFEGGHYPAMAKFAGAVSHEGLTAAFEVATARDLLGIVPLVEWGDHVARIVDDVRPERIDELLREIVDAQLWGEGSALIERLPPEAHDRVLTRVTDISDAHFTALREAADDGRLSPVAVGLVERAEHLRASRTVS